MVTSRAPDGGWGWVVCAATFFIGFITDGLLYSFGVINVELLEYFGSSRGSTAFIASICTSITFLIGPIVSMLVNKFGCRSVAISGALITSASHLISVFASSLQFLYFSLGFLNGIGYGLIYLPSIVCVASYFDKRRALATGIGVSGSGIGTFVFSPVTSLLVQKYAWQGAILVHAGLLLNCIACSLVLLPLEKRETDNEKKSEQETAVNRRAHIEKSQPSNDAFIELRPKSPTIKTFCDHTSNISTDIIVTLPEKQGLLEQNDYNGHICTTKKTSTDLSINDKGKSTCSWTHPILRCIASFRRHFDFGIFKLVPFNLFMVSSFLKNLGYYVPYIYLPDTAIEFGIDELEAAWLLSIVGITNTVARVLFGFLSDRKWVNRLFLCNTALVICGCSTVVASFMTSFWSLVVYSALF
ncbi:monocarboxylate transporter 12-like [Mya arenaria]|uniref:monocarboxylate transporter 12-like n=1 Tax=Mya arenaria TaxID=6604 RepID=UPI0022E3DD4A|nr:monocarboxylate transporter 12-like [Mya arenaria]